MKESRLIITGGTPLNGSVNVSGAKNAALPILAACILTKGHFKLDNIPMVSDIFIMLKMLNALGVRAEVSGEDSVKIWNNQKIRHIAPYELVTSMRASFFVAGPILARTGYAKVPLPGGCAIGTRPLDIHLNGFKAMGVNVSIEHGFVQMMTDHLKGNDIYLDFPSVGATENIMMAATLADGTTTIGNAAQEPEIIDLADFLNRSGASIEGAGTSTIKIKGTSELLGQNHTVLPDRIEIGTLMIAAAITQGDITINNIHHHYSDNVIKKLEQTGTSITHKKNSIRIVGPTTLTGVDFETQPFPGFPTDMQAQFMSLLTIAKGTSIVSETIFENRFMHVNELIRLGADIRVDNHQAIINGVPKLYSAEVKTTDLRAGAALVLAGLIADGQTQIYGLDHLRRGYYNLPQKLQSLGAMIQRK